jgi:hypothetical protein
VADIRADVPDDARLRPFGPGAAELLVDRVDGSGRGRLTVLVNGALPRFGGRPMFDVDRAIELVPPSLADVESVVHEIEVAIAEPAARGPPAS